MQANTERIIAEETTALRLTYDVRELYVFGSVARGEATEASDIDLLVQFEGPATLRKLNRLREFLADKLGRRVDLLTKGALHPLIADQVYLEAVRVA
jgi:hypothetical protein